MKLVDAYRAVSRANCNLDSPGTGSTEQELAYAQYILEK